MGPGGLGVGRAGGSVHELSSLRWLRRRRALVINICFFLLLFPLCFLFLVDFSDAEQPSVLGHHPDDGGELAATAESLGMRFSAAPRVHKFVHPHIESRIPIDILYYCLSCVPIHTHSKKCGHLKSNRGMHAASNLCIS